MKLDHHLEDHELIAHCIKQNRKAQRLLYERYGPKLKFVCIRYLTDKNSAEDVLNEAFLKVFKKLENFQNKGSFEGWIKRIVINTCLDQNRKEKGFLVPIDESEESQMALATIDYSTHSVDYILNAIDRLPAGNRSVFNLVEIDGYKHKEVSEMLGISESASRSQLTKAKQTLRKLLSNG